MASRLPEETLSKQQLTRKISDRRKHADIIADHAECTVEKAYDGRKTNVTVLTRRVSETTDTAPLSDNLSIKSLNEIDRGDSDIDFDSVFEMHPNVDTDSTEVISYSGVTDTERINCPDCAGSGQTCTDCSGSGEESCSNCRDGIVKHYCGCTDWEKHEGYLGNSAKAYRGEILKPCTACGGDGFRKMGSKKIKCDSCNQQGALAEPCPNCGGDGVSRREDCSRCDGRGSHTCNRCGGSGDVDICDTCEGRANVVKQQVKTVTYELTQRTHTDADETVTDHADEIAWTHTGTEVATDEVFEFDDLPVSLTDVTDSLSEDDDVVNAVAVNTEYYQPVLYEVDVTLDHPTAGTGGDPDTVSVLLSESVLDRDGTFKLENKKSGFIERYIFGVAEALGTAGFAGIATGLGGAIVISIVMAILIDFAGVPNPVTVMGLSHPFDSDVHAFFFIIAGAIAAIVFIGLSLLFLIGGAFTGEYYFGYESAEQN